MSTEISLIWTLYGFHFMREWLVFNHWSMVGSPHLSRPSSFTLAWDRPCRNYSGGVYMWTLYYMFNKILYTFFFLISIQYTFFLCITGSMNPFISKIYTINANKEFLQFSAIILWLLLKSFNFEDTLHKWYCIVALDCLRPLISDYFS